MTSTEAVQRAIDALKSDGCVVFERRPCARAGVGVQLVIMRPPEWAARRVRVLVGKRPPRSKTMAVDWSQIGRPIDDLAVVDPADGRVILAAWEALGPIVGTDRALERTGRALGLLPGRKRAS